MLIKRMTGARFSGRLPALMEAAVLGLLALAAAGCHSARSRVDWFALKKSATPPDFMAGPAGILLTNNTGFSAHLTLQTSSTTGSARPIEGEFLAHGSHLLFAPTGHSDISYIWDVATRSGLVLDEPLQGCATAGSDFQVTNISMSASQPSRANGHSCAQSEVVFSLADGSIERFTVWRAADLDGFPVRIKSGDGVAPFVVDITGVRPETLPDDLFQPPAGFTHYDSPDAMMTELFAREHPVTREQSNPLSSPDSPPASDQPRPGFH
jgi:hypothetical protein